MFHGGKPNQATKSVEECWTKGLSLMLEIGHPKQMIGKRPPLHGDGYFEPYVTTDFAEKQTGETDREQQVNGRYLWDIQRFPKLHCRLLNTQTCVFSRLLWLKGKHLEIAFQGHERKITGKLVGDRVIEHVAPNGNLLTQSNNASQASNKSTNADAIVDQSVQFSTDIFLDG